MSQLIVSSLVIVQGHHKGEVRSVYIILFKHSCTSVVVSSQRLSKNLTDSSVSILQAQLHRHRSVYIIHVWLYPADGSAELDWQLSQHQLYVNRCKLPVKTTDSSVGISTLDRPGCDSTRVPTRMPAIILYTLCFAPVTPKHYSNYTILGIAVKSLK